MDNSFYKLKTEKNIFSASGKISREKIIILEENFGFQFRNLGSAVDPEAVFDKCFSMISAMIS